MLCSSRRRGLQVIFDFDTAKPNGQIRSIEPKPSESKLSRRLQECRGFLNQHNCLSPSFIGKTRPVRSPTRQPTVFCAGHSAKHRRVYRVTCGTGTGSGPTRAIPVRPLNSSGTCSRTRCQRWPEKLSGRKYCVSKGSAGRSPTLGSVGEYLFISEYGPDH